MNLQRLRRKLAVLDFVAWLATASATQAAIFYRVEPGSTFTPYHGAEALGPAEPLTGWFVWQPLPGADAFNASALCFAAPSTRLVLNTTPVNDLATSVFPKTPVTYFGEVVDASGLSVTPLRLTCGVVGKYFGPASNPTRLVYPDLTLWPDGGGLFAGHLRLTAVAVPEPVAAAPVIAALGLASALAATIRARWKANRGKHFTQDSPHASFGE
jgi:hypothetical protein